MNKNTMDAAIDAFLSNGGEITRLRPATKKAVAKASRMAYHRERALNGSERSQKFLENERKRESQMIFSRDERERE